MTRRQKEKRFKRKWQQLMSEQIFRTMSVSTKPSRIRMTVKREGHAVTIAGRSRGYELRIVITAKEEAADDSICKDNSRQVQAASGSRR